MYISKEIINKDFNSKISFNRDDLVRIELNQRYISGSVRMAMGRVITSDDFENMKARMSKIELP